ncbi:DUF885 family protein [Metamycoplasma alkalescens]|uniref:Uncharacterized protein DUF885 n=3 Tax=Metamycoplasma alkalescens TaxID=45363 RepID=A0A318U5K4_9BACT|nr:DUF885 family protein [Metamycoplasma alkalescens]PYF43678.1 uncharacterized protein DUF885 [Metamycoplasma alkalescens]
MPSKIKKGLIATGIVAAVIAVPAALTLIPYSIQKSAFNKIIAKNNELIEQYKKSEQEFLVKYNEKRKRISETKNEIAALEDEYNEKINQENPNQEEIKGLQEQIAKSKEKIQKLENEYQEGIFKFVLPSLEKLAREGNSKHTEDIIKYTALYIVNKHKQFNTKLEDLGKSVDLYYPKEEEATRISRFYQGWINELNKISKINLNVTSTAWVSGLKYEWEIAKDIYASELRLIGVFLEWGIPSAYPANIFYGTFNKFVGDKAEKVQRNLEEGIEKGIILSKVVIKNNIRGFLTAFYQDELLNFLRSRENEKTVLDIIKSSTKVDPKTKAFHEFYVTKYYQASKHGLGENIKELKILKENSINEVEDTIEILNQNRRIQKIYGLGLTKKDLDARDVGLSGMPIQGKKEQGQRLYDTILKLSTTSNYSSQEVFDSGYETTKTALKNMEIAAKAVAKLITGEDSGAWEPTIQYNPKGVSGKRVNNVQLKIRDEEGNINLSEFNKWMNQEQFFFGREGKEYYNQDKRNELLNDPNLKESIANLDKLGYAHLKDSKDPYGTITNEQFYLGALEGFKAYQQFRKTTIDEGFSYFPKQVPNYGITIYEFKDREKSGVGAYNGERQSEANTFGSFIFNADPYYGLPKWSVTSFANHESVMGHHNQIYYAEKFLKTINGQTIGNIFNYTSYIEGWALFMEWFGIEAGLYGEPDFENKDYYASPKDFTKAKGITSFIKAKKVEDVTKDETKQMKELHGGVYWNLVASVKKINNEKEHTLKAAELTNILQYYGALNEAQLRNMRRAVDTAYHGNVKGEADLPKNPSISDIRNFLKNNSALGIGDITAESKRYLNLPGQSTSYNAGKEEMLNLYDKVRKSKNLSRKDFVSNKENIKEFLNLMLETGALPLDALKEITELHYNL